MNERLKEIRSALNLSMRSFAERLGMSSGAISMLENGQRNLTSQFIKALCKEFNVNETWLRTGEGEMFAPSTREQELADISVSLFKDNDFKSSLIRYIMKMNPDDLKRLELWLDEFSKFREEQKKPPTS